MQDFVDEFFHIFDFMKIIGKICFAYRVADFNKNQHIFTDTIMCKIDALFGTTSHLVENGSALVQSDGQVLQEYLSIVYELRHDDPSHQLPRVLDALCWYYISLQVAFDVWFDKYPYHLKFL